MQFTFRQGLNYMSEIDKLFPWLKILPPLVVYTNPLKDNQAEIKIGGMTLTSQEEVQAFIAGIKFAQSMIHYGRSSDDLNKQQLDTIPEGISESVNGDDK